MPNHDRFHACLHDPRDFPFQHVHRKMEHARHRLHFLAHVPAMGDKDRIHEIAGVQLRLPDQFAQRGGSAETAVPDERITHRIIPPKYGMY